MMLFLQPKHCYLNAKPYLHSNAFGIGLDRDGSVKISNQIVISNPPFLCYIEVKRVGGGGERSTMRFHRDDYVAAPAANTRCVYQTKKNNSMGPSKAMKMNRTRTCYSIM